MWGRLFNKKHRRCKRVIGKRMSEACHGFDKVKGSFQKRQTDSPNNQAAVTLTGSKVAKIPCWVSSDVHVTA